MMREIRNQKITEALNFIMNKKGYLKCGKDKIKKITKLDGEELDELYEIVKELRNKVYNNGSSDDLIGYWLKTKNISAYFKHHKLNEYNDVIERIKSSVRNIKPIEIDKHEDVVKRNGSCMGVLNIYDIHLDKVPLDYNIKDPIGKLVDNIKYGISHMINKSKKIYDIDTIILPIGGDLFNTNGFTKATKNGTPQETLVDHSIVFRIGIDLCMSIINGLVKDNIKVIVPIIYGNHDKDVNFYLGMILEKLYENIEDVSINNDFLLRKYYTFGNNMFGFGHGDIEKKNINNIPLVMATEKPEYWSSTKTRIFYLGDIHHKQEYKFLRTKDYPGCTVMFLRSVSFMDRWHHENMFIGINRTMEFHIYDKENGNECNLFYNIL